MDKLSNLEKARIVLENRGYYSPSIVNGYLYVTLGDGIDTEFTSVAIHEIEIEELANQYDQ